MIGNLLTKEASENDPLWVELASARQHKVYRATIYALNGMVSQYPEFRTAPPDTASTATSTRTPEAAPVVAQAAVPTHEVAAGPYINASAQTPTPEAVPQPTVSVEQPATTSTALEATAPSARNPLFMTEEERLAEARRLTEKALQEPHNG